MVRTEAVVLNITYDDAKVDPPSEWDWAEIVGDVWVTGDDLGGSAIPLTMMDILEEE